MSYSVHGTAPQIDHGVHEVLKDDNKRAIARQIISKVRELSLSQRGVTSSWKQKLRLEINPGYDLDKQDMIDLLVEARVIRCFQNEININPRMEEALGL